MTGSIGHKRTVINLGRSTYILQEYGTTIGRRTGTCIAREGTARKIVLAARATYGTTVGRAGVVGKGTVGETGRHAAVGIDGTTHFRSREVLERTVGKGDIAASHDAGRITVLSFVEEQVFAGELTVFPHENGCRPRGQRCFGIDQRGTVATVERTVLERERNELGIFGRLVETDLENPVVRYPRLGHRDGFALGIDSQILVNLYRGRNSHRSFVADRKFYLRSSRSIGHHIGKRALFAGIARGLGHQKSFGKSCAREQTTCATHQE